MPKKPTPRIRKVNNPPKAKATPRVPSLRKSAKPTVGEQITAILESDSVKNADNQEQLEALYGKKGVPDMSDSPAKSTLTVNANGNVVSIRPEVKNKVILIEDHKLEYPEMWMAIYIAGNNYDVKQFGEMFARARCYKAKDVASADLVVFTGGPDVSPVLYGEEQHASTHPHRDRDWADIRLYAYCLEKGIPMFGVCRGAQFLHVMNGGKLYQDLDSHNSAHAIWCPVDRRTVQNASSVHHQACIRNDDMDVLAVARKSTRRIRDVSKGQNVREAGIHVDGEVEAFYYKDTACLGVQGHPEYKGFPQYTQWCLKQVEQYVIFNLDLDWIGRVRRLKQSVIDTRTTTEIPAAAGLFLTEAAPKNAPKEIV